MDLVADAFDVVAMGAGPLAEVELPLDDDRDRLGLATDGAEEDEFGGGTPVEDCVDLRLLLVEVFLPWCLSGCIADGDLAISAFVWS